jgi:hypothetical protein
MTDRPMMTDVNTAILVDTEEGYPENRAWVQVTPDIDTPEKALEFVRREFPEGERELEEAYITDDETVWLRPNPEDDMQWEPALPELRPGRRDARRADGAREFWTISVVCHA